MTALAPPGPVRLTTEQQGPEPPAQSTQIGLRSAGSADPRLPPPSRAWVEPWSPDGCSDDRGGGMRGIGGGDTVAPTSPPCLPAPRGRPAREGLPLAKPAAVGWAPPPSRASLGQPGYPASRCPSGPGGGFSEGRDYRWGSGEGSRQIGHHAPPPRPVGGIVHGPPSRRGPCHGPPFPRCGRPAGAAEPQFSPPSPPGPRLRPPRRPPQRRRHPPAPYLPFLQGPSPYPRGGGLVTRRPPRRRPRTSDGPLMRSR